MNILRTLDDVINFREHLAKEKQPLALVPTMGALHAGHLSLMTAGRERAEVVATSIFVNPTQFGANEDLSRYPRDLEGDIAKCKSAGCTVIFAPEASTLYAPNFQTSVEVSQVSQGLCGERRPGHFRGVATVVTKLLALFRPQVALFGEKDFQQLQVIRALNRDLHLGVDIVGMPIVREADGLAMSSRNAYLTQDERMRAVSISQALFAAKSAVEGGESSVDVLVTAVQSRLRNANLREDYVEIRDEETLSPSTTVNLTNASRLFVACFAGKTRLIDNVKLA